MKQDSPPRSLTAPGADSSLTRAFYRVPQVPVLRGNPFIEALPDTLCPDDLVKRLNRYPQIGEAERALPNHERKAALADLQRLYITSDVHEDIESRVSILMRHGYVGRNPLSETKYWLQAAADAQALSGVLHADPSSYNFCDDEMESSAPVLTILGVSGIGKTTLLTRLRNMYPKYIDHGGDFRGRQFGSYRQIPWINLNVPEKGSIKGLLLAFFKAVDRIAGTRHYFTYGSNGRRSADAMVQDVPTVVGMHGIGLLSLDELHNLNAAASGGDVAMINLLVHLIDQAKLPIILVGSFGCMKFLSKEYRIMRRTLSNCVIWDRMLYDPLWHYFAKAMWKYQVLRRPTECTEQLSAILYDECQGITAYAVTLFREAQLLAIEDGTESITPKILHGVARRNPPQVNAVLNALRTNNREALEGMPDIYLGRMGDCLGEHYAYTTGGKAISKPPGKPVQPAPELLRYDEAPAGRSGEAGGKAAELCESTVLEVVRTAGDGKPESHLALLRSKGMIADLSVLLAEP